MGVWSFNPLNLKSSFTSNVCESVSIFPLCDLRLPEEDEEEAVPPSEAYSCTAISSFPFVMAVCNCFSCLLPPMSSMMLPTADLNLFSIFLNHFGHLGFPLTNTNTNSVTAFTPRVVNQTGELTVTPTGCFVVHVHYSWSILDSASEKAI
jgi:hypothetical protein